METLYKVRDLKNNDAVRWTAKGFVCGGLYGALMASQHGLIGTRTARNMVVKSAIIIGIATAVYPLSLQLYRSTINHRDDQAHITPKEAAVAGCSSGASMGVMMGSPPAAFGTCMIGAALAAFGSVMLHYRDVPVMDIEGLHRDKPQ